VLFSVLVESSSIGARLAGIIDKGIKTNKSSWRISGAA